MLTVCSRDFQRPRVLLILIPVVLSLGLALSGCAGAPAARGAEGSAFEVRSVSGGMDVIESPGWTAVRASTEKGWRLGAASAFTEDGVSLGGHVSADLSDSAVGASLVGSPHDPIRFLSGRPQSVSGYFRLGDMTLSAPDGVHDALGLDDSGRPFLLPPEEQNGGTRDALAGFYAVLLDGEAREAVPARDAVGAVGWSGDGSTVILFVSRGRKGKGYSYGEAGGILRSLGADTALAMDGGGSARLVWREGGQVMSYPDKPLYRAVPNRVVLVWGGED